MAAVSSGDATTPSRPEACASAARCTTWSITGRAVPISASAASSMLVSTVTPITSGRGRPSFAAAASPASAAARIIALPPEQCTLTIHAPVATADVTAPATVLGMSWNFRSRNTRSPRSASARTIAGPSAVNSCLPILKPPTAPRSCVGQREGAGPPTRHRARRGSGSCVRLGRRWPCRRRPTRFGEPGDAVPRHVVVEAVEQLRSR